MASEEPARVVSTRNVYTGRIIALDIERVKLPHGPEVDMELVRHPGSVVLLPMPRPGALMLVRQYRHAVGRYLWELPAGSLGKDEEPEEGARRECHEEIGLVPGRMERVAVLYPTPGFCTEKMNFYLCTDLRTPSTVAHQDEDEDLEPRTFEIEEIRVMVKSGEIVDMKTAVGITLV